MKSIKIPAFLGSSATYESFYTGKKTCHYAVCENVNFYVVFIKVKSPYAIAREYQYAAERSL